MGTDLPNSSGRGAVAGNCGLISHGESALWFDGDGVFGGEFSSDERLIGGGLAGFMVLAGCMGLAVSETADCGLGSGTGPEYTGGLMLAMLRGSKAGACLRCAGRCATARG